MSTPGFSAVGFSAGFGSPSGLRRLAVIDASALAVNIALLAAARDKEPVSVDARANAYGHGIETLVRAAEMAGVRFVRVSTAAEAEMARSVGLAVTTDPAHDLGLDIYGFSSQHGVMTLSSEIVAVKEIAAGTGVSYGYTYRATRPTTIALVPLGFADGIPRRASNRGEVSVAGRRHPLIGRIAMDQFVVDLGDSVAQIGDEVTLWGPTQHGHPSIGEWAVAAERSAADLTAGLGSRVARKIHDDGWVTAGEHHG